MSLGIKIAKPGFTTAASAENLYVDSNTPILKIAYSGTGSITFASTDTLYTLTVAHNLGYNPQFAVYSEYLPGSGVVRLVSSTQTGITSDRIYVDAAVSTSNLIADFHAAAGNPAGTYAYAYQIYYDPLK